MITKKIYFQANFKKANVKMHYFRGVFDFLVEMAFKTFIFDFLLGLSLSSHLKYETLCKI